MVVRIALALAGVFVVTASPAHGQSVQHGPRCGTPHLLRSGAVRVAPPPVAFGAPASKQTRDPFGGSWQLAESDNFALRWVSGGVSESEVTDALATLEDAWAHYIDVLGHSVPAGAETYRINAYVSNTEQEPYIDFAGGYAWTDVEGHVYLVVSDALFAPMQDHGRAHVLVHELYHDIQLGLGSFEGHGGYWFWEATADWAAQEIEPERSTAYGFIGAFGLRPDLSVFYTGDPFGDPVAGVHQYGASVFPRYVTQRFDDSTIVARAWEQGAPSDDPLQTMSGLLPESDIESLWLEFAPRMALWDMDYGTIIERWVDAYDDQFENESRWSLQVGPEGTDGWVTVDRLPRAFGANLIEIARPASGTVVIEIEVDAEGSLGTAADTRAIVVSQGGGIHYTPIEIEDGRGRIEVELLVSGYLIVANTADTRAYDETFGYRVSVRPGQPPDADAGPAASDAGFGANTDRPADCGCRSSNQAPPTGALVLLGWLWASRRRRRRRPSS